MITALTVNHNTLDFLKLLVQSVRRFRGSIPDPDHGDRQRLKRWQREWLGRSRT
jgi:hypothetical protein